MMDQTTPTDTPPRKRRAPAIDIRPILVSHEQAAAMLADISERTLDQLVAQGRIKARQLTKGRVGYLLRELEAFADTLPVVTPGRRPAPGGQPAP